MKYFSALFFLLATDLTVNASGLAWLVTERMIKADVSAKTVHVEFPFKNISSNVVIIKSVVPSCDCMKVSLGKEVIAPGETGDVRVDYAVAGSIGRSERTINVLTNSSKLDSTNLRIVLQMEDPVIINPQVVTWQLKASMEEKTVELTFANANECKFLNAQCSDPAFSVRSEIGPIRGQWRIKILPVRPDSVVQALVRIALIINGNSTIRTVRIALKR